MTLFDEHTGVATAAQVRALTEEFGYDRVKVSAWTPEHAETVLRARRNEDRIGLKRAAKRAAEIDHTADVPPELDRPAPGTMWRELAAKDVEQQLADGDPDEVLQTVAYSLHTLTDDELRRLAGYLVKLWRQG